jgi:hypothetical protein
MTTSTWTEQVHRGTEQRQPRMVIYGAPKLGKSTLGASMPKPIVIDFDRGLSAIAVDSVPGPATWLDTMSLLKWAASSKYETIVIDTLDPLEEQATAHVCAQGKKSTLADFPWGGGYDALAGEWRVMLSLLEQSNKIVCLLAHSVVKKAQDPTLGEYEQYVPQLQKKTWLATHRWADLIGFVSVDAAKIGDENRVIVTGERVLHTSHGSGFIAGNRWSMPEKLPLSWPAIAAAMNTSPAQIREEVLALAKGDDRKKAEEFLKEAGDDVGKLRLILQAIKEKTK